jgi:hypothetical protein
VKQEEPTPEPQSEEPESFEPVDPEPDIMEKLRERHKEVFGKYPNKNWSKEVIHQRIEDELNQPDPEPEEEVEDPVFTTETAEEMHARVEEEDKDEPAESFEPVNEPEPALKANEDFDAEAVDEEPSYHGDAFSQATQKVQAYTDPAELKESAGQIVFEAELEGANEDEIKQLKLVINNQYLHLVNGSE